MAIVTDSIVDVGTYTTFNIGLSKAISNYTAEEVWNFPYCSSQWEYYKHIGQFETKPLMDFAPGGTGDGTNELFPLKYTGRNDMYYPQTYWFDPGEIEYNNPNGIYCRVIWLYGSNEQIANLLTGKRRSIYGTDGFKIVTQMDMTKVFIFLDNFHLEPWTNSANVNNINTLNYDNFKIKEEHDDITSYSHPRNCSIFPVVMFKVNDKLYLHLLFQRLYESLDWSWGLNASQNTSPDHAQGWEWDAQPTSFDGSEGCYFPVNIGRDFGGLRPQNVESFHTPTDITDIGAMYQWYYYGQTGGRINPVTEQAYLKLASWYGGMFYHNGKYYKPIIEGGYVTGYTDDMTVPSDIDNWIGNTNHDVPPAPPGPAPGPYDDDEWNGATFAGTGVGGAGAFAKVYYMTSTELANLRSWMNSINVPEGFDPMQQIIGLSQVPVALSGSGPENVVFVNSSAVYDPGVTTRAVDTGVATQQAMGTPISYYLGSVDIVRRMQERGEPYLDYDCQIELYLPLIGMFSLDTQAVMGRTISAYAVLDPVSGTLAAYAYVTKGGQNLPIAYGSTTIGVDLPISAQQLSVSRAALKQANAQLGASLLSGALTMLAAASTGGKSSGSGAKTSTGSSGLSAAGIREAGSDYMKASQVGNVFGDFMNWGRTIRQLSYGNNTAVTGSFGGSTAQWSYPFTPYVKIIRPRYEKPSNYAHSQGVPCVQTKTIGSCTGFIQCIGADVSGITGATDLELQAIQAALSNGIYAGGGQ